MYLYALTSSHHNGTSDQPVTDISSQHSAEHRDVTVRSKVNMRWLRILTGYEGLWRCYITHSLADREFPCGSTGYREWSNMGGKRTGSWKTPVLRNEAPTVQQLIWHTYTVSFLTIKIMRNYSNNGSRNSTLFVVVVWKYDWRKMSPEIYNQIFKLHHAIFSLLIKIVYWISLCKIK